MCLWLVLPFLATQQAVRTATINFLRSMHGGTRSYAAFILFHILLLYSAGVLAGNVFGFIVDGQPHISSSTEVAQNGVTFCDHFSWVRTFGGALVGLHGSIADCEEVFDALSSETSKYQLQFPGSELTPDSCAHLCRSIISRRLRTRQRLEVSVLVGGVRKSVDDGKCSGDPVLLWVDDLGSLHNVRYAAHGPDAAFLLSVLDRHRMQLGSRPSVKASPMETAEHLCATKIATSCWQQLHTRSRGRVNLGTAKLYSAHRDGVSTISLAT
jgi:hypothetical protein